MPSYPIIEDTLGRIQDLSQQVRWEDGQEATLKKVLLAFIKVIQGLTRAVNGKLNLGQGKDGYRAGNFDAQYRVITTPAVPQTEYPVIHGLGRTPVGFIPVGQDVLGGTISSRQRSWDSGVMYLKTNAVSMTITLLIF